MAADWQNFIRRPLDWFDTWFVFFSQRLISVQRFKHTLVPSTSKVVELYRHRVSNIFVFRGPTKRGEGISLGRRFVPFLDWHDDSRPVLAAFRNEITSLSISPGFVRASPRFLANGIVTMYERRWVYVCGNVVTWAMDGYIFPRIVCYLWVIWPNDECFQTRDTGGWIDRQRKTKIHWRSRTTTLHAFYAIPKNICIKHVRFSSN